MLVSAALCPSPAAAACTPACTDHPPEYTRVQPPLSECTAIRDREVKQCSGIQQLLYNHHTIWLDTQIIVKEKDNGIFQITSKYWILH